MNLIDLPLDLFKYYFYYYLDNPTIWSLKQTCKLLYNRLYLGYKVKLNIYDLIKFGYKHLYKYAIKNITKNNNIPTFKLVNYACLYGQLHLLKYFYNNGYTFTEDACSSAAAGGYLNVLKWLKKKNINWDQWTIACAINNKNYDILEYAIKHNAPTGYFAEQALNRYYLYILKN